MTMLFTFKIRYYVIFIFLVVLNGCALNPNTIFNKNMLKSSDSSIIWPKSINHSNYQESNTNDYHFEPLFEDYKPRNVGDTFTVILQENLSASNNLSSNLIHDGNADLGITFGNDYKSNNYENQTGLNSFFKNNFTGKESSFANNQFVGLITVTVEKILPNGNLEVSGEKKISINKEGEKIYFSGVVNPRTISKNNSVISTQIANAHIEYISDGFINKGLNVGWFQRLFLSILSF
ncbi:MAG: flagellar basal body L-ring protein FlgH [Buchnera aphidicola (Kaburagia rhusicola ensigallis)]